MAERIWAPTKGVEAADPKQFWKGYEAIIRKEYPGVETMVGAQFWGTSELSIEGLHNEIYYHTGLLGSAVSLGRDYRVEVPMATYADIDQIVADYEYHGIGYEYYAQELGDNLMPDVILSKVGDLPMLLADHEEDEHLLPYNTGETFVSGYFNQPLFVSGANAANSLKTIGYKDDLLLGSNIIKNAGGPSYHLISLLEQYGMNFLNEEGRLSPLGIDRILCSPQNKRLLDMLFGAQYNIEQSSSLVPNPVQGTAPMIVATHRLANPNDIIVFYQGWEEDMKERSKWRGQPMSEEVGQLNFKKTVHMIWSRFAYYFTSNRRVVLVKGAA